MALPESYTDETFAAYLHALLNAGGFAGDLGWSVAAGSYDEITNDALGIYGAEDIESVTGAANIRKLRVAGRVALWQGVVNATVHLRDSRTVDGAQSSLSQVHAHAKAQLDAAKGEAAAVGLDAALYPPIVVGAIRYKDDPYYYYESAEDA